MRIKSIKWPYFISILALSLLMLVMLFAPIVQAQSPQDSPASDAYDYPIKPGTTEWKIFTTLVEKIAACQIPEDVLKSMSTKGLVETVLNYPLLLNFRAYNDLQYGFNQVSSYFNGLKELYTRIDAGTELLARYSNMDPAAFKNEWTELERGAYGLSFQNIEMLLAQEPIMATLTPGQAEMLASIAATKNQIMQDNTNIYGILNAATNSALVEKASKRQYSERWYWTTVYTPKHSGVPAKQMNPAVYPEGDEFSSAQKAALNAEMDAAFPYATRVRSATNMYVCHTYAWYSQSAYTTIVILAPNQSTYWTDGSYSRYYYSPYVGLRVRYTDTDHSAIVYQIYPILKYISKWAYYGLYIHTPLDSPFYGTTCYYYYPN